MAETLEQLNPMNKLENFKELMETLDRLTEFNKEKCLLNECNLVKKINDDIDMLIEALKLAKSTLENIMDNRNAIAKRLKNPISPNAFLLEYKMHEDFLKYCREIPRVLSILKPKKNAEGFALELDDDSKLIYSMEREIKWQKLYISCVKGFLSDLDEYETQFNKLTDFLKKNEDGA